MEKMLDVMLEEILGSGAVGTSRSTCDRVDRVIAYLDRYRAYAERLKEVLGCNDPQPT